MKKNGFHFFFHLPKINKKNIPIPFPVQNPILSQ